MAGAGAATRAATKALGGQTGAGKLISGLGGIGGLISIGSSLAGLFSGIGQKKKAKKAMAAAELLNPGVEGYQAVANETEQAAREGLGAQQYNRATTNIQRGTASALGALGKLPNAIAGISNINRNQQDALGDLGVQDELAKRVNRDKKWQAQYQLQQARQQQYADAYNAAQAMMGAGQQNIAGSIGSLGQYGLMQSIYGQGNQGGGNRNPSNKPLPTGGISTGGFNAWQLPGAMGGSALPGNNFSGINTRLNTINPATRRTK